MLRVGTADSVRVLVIARNRARGEIRDKERGLSATEILYPEQYLENSKDYKGNNDRPPNC